MRYRASKLDCERLRAQASLLPQRASPQDPALHP